MELYDMLHPMLELSVSLPAIILCFLPMKNHLNGKGKLLLLWGIPTLILWCVGMGWLCRRFHYSTKLCMLLTQALLLLFYCKAVPLSRWKTVNVFLAVCGVFSGMYNLAILIDALLFRRSGAVALSLNSSILYVLLCWLLLGILCYPATHAARWLLDEVETPETWYIFWILPLVFWCLNTTLRPRKYSTLYTNRVMHFYPILILALLGLMLLYYALFYWMARGLAKNIRLSQENKLLQMQTAQYRTLQKSIADTRRARHDLHQHFKALQGCVESGDISKVAAYVKMRVWERGSGETWACGTGASATVVACVLNEKTGRKVDVELIGGTLTIEWKAEDNHVYMTGPAEFSFDGEWLREV